jgi:outer membrane protein OmpA-like peptidoglycan-associated protein
MKKIKLILCYGLVLMLVGCASAKKAELTSGDNAVAAVSEVAEIMYKAEDEQSDLLSFKLYTKGMDYLKRARLGLTRNHSKESILENAAIAKAYFQEARVESGVRKSNAVRILQARKSSLQAGLRNSKKLLVSLADVDDDLRDETDEFSKTLDPKEFSEFQKIYLSLEIEAVQFSELDTSIQAIQYVIKRDAEDLTPNALRIARMDINAAENLIAQSPRNPEIHQKSVKKALDSTALLVGVMDVILNAEGTPEHIALRIYKQNQELGVLSKNVGSLQANLKSTKSNLALSEDALKSQEEALRLQKEGLRKSAIQVKFQKAMDEARVQFSEDEATVYQQGSKLIFRLKRINFASGAATIPMASKPLLSKVNDIIRTLDAKIVAVHGHTDSVGAADYNLKLSTKRAISVAKYLASFAGGYKIGYIGYGESKPMASNETQQGRAINRRVDLVVTAKK